ncbi:hypothetical protein [Paenibacillus odorifer]|uniref:hypothetical protein n=1 Tax=Paenibacillus odorifer TaxID=189426 RepID=UPI0019551F29|nr:hypothetical protein [Paenibacillus odorifer]
MVLCLVDIAVVSRGWVDSVVVGSVVVDNVVVGNTLTSGAVVSSADSGIIGVVDIIAVLDAGANGTSGSGSGLSPTN